MAYSIMSSTKGFEKTNYLKSSKSAFFLPIKNKDERQGEKEFLKMKLLNSTSSKTFQSHFQLPDVINPLAISKEKQ